MDILNYMLQSSQHTVAGPHLATHPPTPTLTPPPHFKPGTSAGIMLTALSAVCKILLSMPLKKPPSPSSRVMRQMQSHVPVYLHHTAKHEAVTSRVW